MKIANTATRVTKGARELDGRLPGWVSLLDVQSLNPDCPHACVGAQLAKHPSIQKQTTRLLNSGQCLTPYGAFVHVIFPDMEENELGALGLTFCHSEDDDDIATDDEITSDCAQRKTEWIAQVRARTIAIAA